MNPNAIAAGLTDDPDIANRDPYQSTRDLVKMIGEDSTDGGPLQYFAEIVKDTKNQLAYQLEDDALLLIPFTTMTPQRQQMLSYRVSGVW